MYINGVWFEECEARAYVNRLLAELRSKDELLRELKERLSQYEKGEDTNEAKRAVARQA